MWTGWERSWCGRARWTIGGGGGRLGRLGRRWRSFAASFRVSSGPSDQKHHSGYSSPLPSGLLQTPIRRAFPAREPSTSPSRRRLGYEKRNQVSFFPAWYGPPVLFRVVQTCEERQSREGGWAG